jgi:hypothetical protein
LSPALDLLEAEESYRIYIYGLQEATLNPKTKRYIPKIPYFRTKRFHFRSVLVEIKKEPFSMPKKLPALYFLQSRRLPPNADSSLNKEGPGKEKEKESQTLKPENFFTNVEHNLLMYTLQ